VLFSFGKHFFWLANMWQTITVPKRKNMKKYKRKSLQSVEIEGF
jgi:hypothetical protein